MKLIIAGSREFNNYALMKRTLQDLEDHKNLTVIAGGARGADALGEKWAKEHNKPFVEYPAKWDRYGRSAGYIRNKEMADNATHLVAFWDGRSRGTGHMIGIAQEKGLNVHTVYY